LKAILPVDVFGQPADYDALNSIAKENGLAIIEDSCEALGALYKDRPAGMLADAGVFAFYPNKQITTGEGGVIVTQNDVWADSCRSLRNQGRAPGDTWLEHTHLGYNYRLDEMSATLGRVQISRLDELLEKRRRVAGWYAERLEEVSSVEVPFICADTTQVSWFVYVIRLAADFDRTAVIDRLAAAGIPSRPYFAPIHTQPYFMDRFGCQSGDFPVTEDLGRRSLALPFSSVMTEDDVDRVCEALQKNIGG
jgi:dTDP-4-amino-4,6-dideoxygalactose transaminase